MEMFDAKVDHLKTTTAAIPPPLQTKGGDWDVTRMLDRNDGFDGRLSTRRQHHDIIVIASLVDNHFNLGGISRVCELLVVRIMSANLQKIFCTTFVIWTRLSE